MRPQVSNDRPRDAVRPPPFNNVYPEPGLAWLVSWVRCRWSLCPLAGGRICRFCSLASLTVKRARATLGDRLPFVRAGALHVVWWLINRVVSVGNQRLPSHIGFAGGGGGN